MGNDKFKGKYRVDSIRLPGWDYTSNGYYFVTICAKSFGSVFGYIKNDRMCLYKIGSLIWQYWLDIPNHFHHVYVDEFIVMPNHVHGIIRIDHGSAQSFVACDECNNKTHPVESLHRNASPAYHVNDTLGISLQNGVSNKNHDIADTEILHRNDSPAYHVNDTLGIPSQNGSSNKNRDVDVFSLKQSGCDYAYMEDALNFKKINDLKNIYQILSSKQSGCGDLNAVADAEALQCNASTVGTASSKLLSSISPKSGSIPTIIRSFKSVCTREINTLFRKHNVKQPFVWQSGYYESIIRDQIGLRNIREYIKNNPTKWLQNAENIF